MVGRTIRQVEFTRPIQPRLKRVAAYARVSTGKDAMLHSLSAQVSYYSQLIQSHDGWLYCGVFSDEAYSGTKENRDGFRELLEECRAEKIDMVITKSISRLARNTVTLLQTVRELKLLGVDIFFEEQNLHTMSADGELMMTILASYAQEESRSASENQKWRVRQSFQKGELVNFRFMFGYNISNGKISINPFEASVVQEIYSRVIKGESFSSISRDLEARNIPRVFGGPWDERRIRDLVANEKYTGNALLQKYFRNNYLEKKSIKNTGELPMYYAEGTHPAIIDEETFGAAQVVLDDLEEKAKTWQKRKTGVFTGHIVCCKCGRNFKRVISNGTVGWNCSTYQRYGKTACKSKKIPEETLKSVIAELLGIAEFSDEAFAEAIDYIEVPSDNQLRFNLRDGTIEERTWKDRSRKDSWTDEMRAKAAAHTRQQWREKNVKSNNHTSNQK